MAETNNELAFDLRRIGQIIRKRIWVAVTFFVVVVVLTVIGSVMKTATYRATGMILIEREAPNVVSLKDVVALGTTNYYDTKSYYETQFKIIKSRTTARLVIHKLKLDREPPYSKAVDPIETFLNQVAIDPIKGSHLVSISFNHHDPQEAAQIANTIAETYIEENLLAKQNASDEAIKWLSNQEKELDKKMQDSELALQGFMEKNNILSFEERQSIIEKRITSLTTAYADARQKRIEAESLYNRVKLYAVSSEKSQSIPDVLKNDLIQELKSKQFEYERERTELAQKYKEKHPAMTSVIDQLDLVEKRLNSEINRIVRGVEAQYLVEKDREEAFVAELETIKLDKRELDKKEIDFKSLEREVIANRNLFDVLQQRAKETEIIGKLRANNVRIIDRAEAPLYPISPRKRLNVALGMILGVLGGIGLIFFFEFVDNTIKNTEDIENTTGLPFLGIIPSFEGENGEEITTDLFAHEHPKSSVTESCRVIRTNLTFSAPDASLRRLLVTSAGPQEGKSTTVINLGIVLAQGGKRVLLIDSDLRRPRLHRAFGFSSDLSGLTNLIMGEDSLDNVLVDTEVPGLSLIPCGPIPPTPSELLGSRQMENILKDLEERFDWVLFDSPPVVAVTDAVVISQLVDGVVLVVKAGQTSRDLLAKALKQLSDVDATILGTVLNDFNVKGEGYRYYHYYHSYHSNEKKKTG